MYVIWVSCSSWDMISETWSNTWRTKGIYGIPWLHIETNMEVFNIYDWRLGAQNTFNTPRNISEMVLFKPSKKSLYKMEEAGIPALMMAPVFTVNPGGETHGWNRHLVTLGPNFEYPEFFHMFALLLVESCWIHRRKLTWNPKIDGLGRCFSFSKKALLGSMWKIPVCINELWQVHISMKIRGFIP